jgi:non-specific serine/threonine protein kinase
MTFRGSNKKIPEIAKGLNVRYVLEGSVRKAGDRLRITAQLIDATSDIHIWANKYSGTLEDVFDFQEQVSRGIVEALRVRLTAEQDRRIAERPIDNVAAYDAYLQASREIIGGATADALGRATRLLQNALDMVGPNALIYAGMASTHWQYVNIGLMQEDGIALMDEYLGKALALDSELPEANAIRGMADIAFHGCPQDAARRFKEALAVKPNEPNALPFLGCAYITCGKMDAAASVVDRLSRVDPLTWFTHWLKGAVHFYAGRYELALEDYRTLYELWPDHFAGQLFYALELTHNGDNKLAIEILNRATATESAHGFVKMLKHALLGDKEQFDRELTPELQKTAARDPDWSYHVAVMHALLGVHEETLRWIEQAASRGMINYPLLAELDPFLDDVRGDERFKKLMVRVKKEWEEFEV